MLKQSEILTAVKNTIKTAYSNTPVYFEDNLENFNSPCFFCKLLQVRSLAGNNLYYNDCTLYIDYFAAKGKTTTLEMYNIMDTIAELFANGLKIKDRYIEINSIGNTTEGLEADIIHFNLPFTYYDSIETTDKYMIEHIETGYKTKNY